MSSPTPTSGLRRAELSSLPSKDELTTEFNGKHVLALSTPALVINRAIVRKNCAAMQDQVLTAGALFRAHVKTHKTTEGIRLQMFQGDGRGAIVVSTLMEAWQVLRSGLVRDGTVKDILYGMPVPVTRVPELITLLKEIGSQGGALRLLVDHPAQVRALSVPLAGTSFAWSVFVKVDPGYRRAGLVPESAEFDALFDAIEAVAGTVEVFGFYCHAGNSYSSTSVEEASSYLQTEIAAVNAAARRWKERAGASSSASFVLSVGSTPTAHAFTGEADKLEGKLEVHAGNYIFHDLQQLATGEIGLDQIAFRVLASVASVYPGRGPNGEDEVLIDVGGIGLSKDTGPMKGFGRVVSVLPGGDIWDAGVDLEKAWTLVRISQEHGILQGSLTSQPLKPGETVALIAQHACLVAAAHPWFYVVDTSFEPDAGVYVEDVWVPWKGW